MIKVELICNFCKKSFLCLKKKAKYAKFCSMDCVYQGRKQPEKQRIRSDEEKLATREKCRNTAETKRVYITRNCLVCQKEFTGFGKNFVKKYCSNACVNKANEERFSGENNPMFGKTAWTKAERPEVAENLSRRHKENGVNVGDRNGMKKPESRKKASISAKKKFENPEMRAITSRGLKKAWADGAYDGVRVGQCKWHDYTKKNGEVIKLQGLWELEFAKYLDDNDIEFTTHVGKFQYLDETGSQRSYLPDFFLIQQQLYVDVKNPYYEIVHASKIEAVKRCNPEIKLEIYGKEKLQSLGLKLSGVSNED